MQKGSSTAAFLSARPLRLHSVDITKKIGFVDRLERLAAQCGATSFQFLQQSSLEVKLKGEGALPAPDLLFLDTLHAGPQLSRELSLLGPSVRRYIVLHDTATNAFEDEGAEHYPDLKGYNDQTSGSSDLPSFPGLWAAIIDFLVAFPEWFLALRCFNNCGLVVLRRSESAAKDAESRRWLRTRTAWTV